MEWHDLPGASDVQQLAAALAPAAAATTPAAVAARSLCSPSPRLHITLLPSEPAQHQPVDLAALADAHLQPALAQLAPAARVSSSVVLHPPELPVQQLRWDAQQGAHILPAAAASVWAQHVQQVAWASGPAHDGSGQPGAQALLYLPPREHQPLLLEAGGASGAGAAGSMQLDDGSLLLVVNQPGPRSEVSGSTSGSSLEQELAGVILSWLLQPLVDPAGTAGEAAATLPQLQQALAAACAAEAAAALQQALATAAAAPSQPLTAGMASQAVQALRLLQRAAAQQQQQAPVPLATAWGAWAAAQALLHDPASGAQPAFPAEHALAVLLPLGLPLSLVLVQAAGREAAAWKKRRRERGEMAAVAAAASAKAD